MRLSNYKKTPIYTFFFSFILLLIVLLLIILLMTLSGFNIFGNKAILLLSTSIILLVLFLLRGKQIFEYDSDGEGLNFKNRYIYSFLGKPVNDEFPKYKLRNFEVVNFILYRKLFISISSKKGNKIVLKYDISYLTIKEIKYLKFSLRKIVHENQKRKELE